MHYRKNEVELRSSGAVNLDLSISSMLSGNFLLAIKFLNTPFFLSFFQNCFALKKRIAQKSICNYRKCNNNV